VGEPSAVDFVVLGGELIRAPKMRGYRFIYKKMPPLLLRSNFDLGFILGLCMGLNLIKLNFRVDANL